MPPLALSARPECRKGKGRCIGSAASIAWGGPARRFAAEYFRVGRGVHPAPFWLIFTFPPLCIGWFRAGEAVPVGALRHGRGLRPAAGRFRAGRGVHPAPFWLIFTFPPLCMGWFRVGAAVPVGALRHGRSLRPATGRFRVGHGVHPAALQTGGVHRPSTKFITTMIPK